MAKLNQKTIDSVSIAEVKALEPFIRAYNKNRDVAEAERQAKILEEFKGKASDVDYQKFLSQSQAYLENGEVPTESEWSQIKTIYREKGNKKIVASRESLEYLSKEYSGVASIAVSETESISPKQVVLNLKRAERGVELVQTLKTVLTIFAGIVGFVGFALFSRILATSLIKDVSKVATGILGGLLSLVGLALFAVIVAKLMGFVVKEAKKERNLAEVAEASNHDKIVLLQTAIKTAEENIKKIEAQYEVEILARTDFSDLLVPVEHNGKKRIKPQTGEGKEPAELKTADENSRSVEVSIEETLEETSEENVQKTE